MRRLFSLLVVCAMSLSLSAQRPKRSGEPDDPVRLPNGKLQQDEMLMAAWSSLAV